MFPNTNLLNVQGGGRNDALASAPSWFRQSRITDAYEQTLHTLCVKDRDDPLTEMIAKMIIKIAQTGGHDAAQISALTIAELRIR
jgi:hypothetical protein